ncbi:MAG TPA: thioredoxin domain-containing protein [Vicinamibacterales bacterium]|nr:thioredoxin domain-containing protein [Vicinamibacterales bacterium]
MARPSIKAVFEGLTTGAMLIASVGVMAYLWQNRRPAGPPEGPLPKNPISLVGTAMEGNPAAPMAVVVFSDFECPFCRSFGGTILPTLRSDYISTGRILVSFRHLPLPGHQAARPAAQAAVCAHAQGRFWSLHDKFFADPVTLRAVDKAMGEIGGDMEAFAACRSSEATAQVVESDLELAKLLQIRGTPTFLAGTNDGGKAVNVTKRFTGAASYESFVQQLGPVQDGPGR